MSGKEDRYRAPAVRALCKITDVSVCVCLDVYVSLSECITDWLSDPLVSCLWLEFDLSLSQSAMLQAIERYMKQAIVARNPTVASAALVSSLVSECVNVWARECVNGLADKLVCDDGDFSFFQHLFSKGSGEVVKRWMNEAQEAANSDNIMVQVCPVILSNHLLLSLTSLLPSSTTQWACCTWYVSTIV